MRRAVFSIRQRRCRRFFLTPCAFLLSFSFTFFFVLSFSHEKFSRPKDEVCVQSVAGRGLAHIYSTRHLQRRKLFCFFFVFLFCYSVRQTNKQKEKLPPPSVFFSFCSFFFVFIFSLSLSPICSFLLFILETDNPGALNVWNLISEILWCDHLFFLFRAGKVSHKFGDDSVSVLALDHNLNRKTKRKGWKDSRANLHCATRVGQRKKLQWIQHLCPFCFVSFSCFLSPFFVLVWCSF